MITPSDITVSIACVFPDMSPVWMMEHTLKKYGYSYKPYGLGQTYKGWIDINIVKLLEEAKNCPTSHILYSDARDAWFCCGPEEVADKYNAMGCPPLMLSAQDRGTPAFPTFYEGIPWDLSKPFPYMWPTGKFCEAKALVDCLQWMLDNIGPDIPGDDPVWWLEYMRAFPGAIVLDHECSIFMNAGSGGELWDNGTLKIILGSDGYCQCGHTLEAHDADHSMESAGWKCVYCSRCTGYKENPIPNRVLNMETGQLPAILHFGGGYSHALTGKWDSIEKHWKAFGYTERPPWE